MSTMTIVPETYYSPQYAWMSTRTVAPSGYFGVPTVDITREPEAGIEEVEAWIDEILKVLPRRAWRKFLEDIGKSAFLVRAGCSLEPLLTTLANWEATAEEMFNERNLREILRAREELRKARQKTEAARRGRTG